MKAGIPVAVGAFDAHLGAVGSGVAPGTLVKIIGKGTCDIAVWPSGSRAGVAPVSNQKETAQAEQENGDRRDACPTQLADIPGLCGIVNGSVLPGYSDSKPASRRSVTFSTGGSITSSPGGENPLSHKELDAARKSKPGESGLLALDRNNGNHTILVDQRLTGLLIGQTLYTTPAEIYRALIEATAFGALTIINRFEEYGVKIRPSSIAAASPRRIPS